MFKWAARNPMDSRMVVYSNNFLQCIRSARERVAKEQSNGNEVPPHYKWILENDRNPVGEINEILSQLKQIRRLNKSKKVMFGK